MLGYPSIPVNPGHPPGHCHQVWTITPDFTFTSHNIKCIPKMYSSYSKGNKVPSGSLAMIGYTMGCYEKDSEWIVPPNLNWGVVIAADDWLHYFLTCTTMTNTWIHFFPLLQKSCQEYYLGHKQYQPPKHTVYEAELVEVILTLSDNLDLLWPDFTTPLDQIHIAAEK